MTAEEITTRLHELFGDSVGEYQTPAAGDPFVIVQAARLREVCEALRTQPEFDFDFLRLITAVDWQDRLSSVYHLYSYKHGHAIVLRVDLPRENPRLPTVSTVWPAANWLEREAFDMMGIVYEGHPELTRILLPADWEGHPLRKDYRPPEEYHGVKHQ